MDKQEIIKLIAEVQTNSAENFISADALQEAKVWPSQVYIVAEGKPIPVPADLEPFVDGELHRRPAPTYLNFVCRPKYDISGGACIRAMCWGGGDVSFLRSDYLSVTDTIPMRLRIAGNQTIEIGDYICKTAGGVFFGLNRRAFAALFDVVGNTTEADWTG